MEPDTPIAILYVKDAAWGLYDLNNAPEERLSTRVYNLYGLKATGQGILDAILKAIPDARIDFKPDAEQIELVYNLPEKLDDAVADFINDIRSRKDIYNPK